MDNYFDRVISSASDGMRTKARSAIMWYMTNYLRVYNRVFPKIPVPEVKNPHVAFTKKEMNEIYAAAKGDTQMTALVHLLIDLGGRIQDMEELKAE